LLETGIATTDRIKIIFIFKQVKLALWQISPIVLSGNVVPDNGACLFFYLPARLNSTGCQ
jgi:hypothetical protein